MKKLFLTAHYHEDDTCEGYIVEIWDMEKNKCLLSLDLTDPYNWRGAQFTHLKGVLITPEVDDFKLVEVPSDKYDITRYILLLSPDVVIDASQRYRIICASDLTDTELKRLGEYTTLAKEEYLRRLKEKYKEAIESL